MIEIKNSVKNNFRALRPEIVTKIIDSNNQNNIIKVDTDSVYDFLAHDYNSRGDCVISASKICDKILVNSDLIIKSLGIDPKLYFDNAKKIPRPAKTEYTTSTQPIVEYSPDLTGLHALLESGILGYTVETYKETEDEYYYRKYNTGNILFASEVVDDFMKNYAAESGLETTIAQIKNSMTQAAAARLDARVACKVDRLCKSSTRAVFYFPIIITAIDKNNIKHSFNLYITNEQEIDEWYYDTLTSLLKILVENYGITALVDPRACLTQVIAEVNRNKN